MKTLIKNGKVINVFTKEIEKLNILIEDDKIIGTGDYCDADADIVKVGMMPKLKPPDMLAPIVLL